MGAASICCKAIFTLVNADQLSGHSSYESADIDCNFWQGVGCFSAAALILLRIICILLVEATRSATSDREFFFFCY